MPGRVALLSRCLGNGTEISVCKIKFSFAEPKRRIHFSYTLRLQICRRSFRDTAVDNLKSEAFFQRSKAI